MIDLRDEFFNEGLKVTFFCDNCHRIMITQEIDEVCLRRLGLCSLTDLGKADIINYTEEAGLHLYALCESCIENM